MEKGPKPSQCQARPKHPVHKLLPEERSAVLEMAKKEEYADLAHRTLTVKAWDLGVFFSPLLQCIASCVQPVLCQCEELTAPIMAAPSLLTARSLPGLTKDGVGISAI